MRHVLYVLLLSLLGLVLPIADATAQSCTATSTNVVFGTVTATPIPQTDVQGTINVTCTGIPGGSQRDLCIALSNGTGTGSSGTQRFMSSGGNAVQFQLYSDSGRTLPWYGQVATPMSNGVAAAIPVYGRLFAAASGVVASYTSTIGVTARIKTNGQTCTQAGSSNAVTIPAFNATVTLAADCTLSIPDVNFGTVTSLAAALNTSTNASVTCTTGTSWTLAMNAGATPGNTFAVRRMNLGGVGVGVVQYQIYRNAGPANIWGDGTGGTVTQTGTGTGAAQSIPIYLQVPGPQGASSEGTYQDTVTATLTF